MSKLKIIALLAAACAVFASCSKSKPLVLHADYYSAGSYIDGDIEYACYYKDDTLKFKSTDSHTCAKDIFYNNGIVYMGGYHEKNGNKIPAIWVDGVMSYPFGEASGVHGCINGLRFVGSTLVMAGYLDTHEATEGDVDKVAFIGYDSQIQWQLDTLYESEITGFVINEYSQMFFCGYKGSATYNQQAFLWTQPLLASPVQETALCSAESYATSVYTVGLNVAVAFVQPQADGTNHAYCNLNGVNNLIAGGNSIVTSITLSRGFIYAGGQYETTSGRKSAILWNGSYVAMIDETSGDDSIINDVVGCGGTPFQIGTFVDGVRGYWGVDRAFTIPGDCYKVEALDVIYYWTN